MKYGVLILAAGASTRMGTSKQLLKIDNQSLLEKTIRTALEINPIKCTVVLGAKFDLHKREIEHLPIDIIHNLDWENGMGSSIKAGVNHLSKFELNAILILVCDQPLLTSNHLRRLTECYERSTAPVVASVYKSVQGVPALFDRSMIPPLLSLKDKEGAKRIIQENINQAIEFEGGEIDLDTMEDVKNYRDS